MLTPVLEIAMEAAREANRPLAMVAGVQGDTAQAVREATQARDLGYSLVLLRPAPGTDDEMIARAKAVGEVLPVVGFYLQPAVGGRVLSRDFWRRFAAIETVAGIKVAPFDRYRTLDVLNGVAQSGRADRVALYTGNDNNIIGDLLSPYVLQAGADTIELRFVGGLLGQFAAWTRRAVELLALVKRATAGDNNALRELMVFDGQLTDANAALFDVANNFHGCIAGINEILARQGLLAGRWCLDPHEDLSPGQAAEIDRVCAAYPHLTDDTFVAEHRDRWLR
jgi:dihydrodipicolinate synthase/N-acetylneuraminate lyase